MPRRKRRRTVYLGEYHAPASIELAPIRQLVDEGALIAAAAVRIAVKNRLIVRILRDGKDFDQSWLDGAVRKELRALAKEKSNDAVRVTEILEKAKDLPGDAERNDDYRSSDVENLDRRHAMLVGLVTRLETLAEDDDYVRELSDAIQDRAWDEISAAIVALALSFVGSTEVLTEADRDLRKEQVRADLRKLEKSLR